MSEAFGNRLRDWREQQHIPLRAIAEQTKISVPLLEGLERGDVSHWPGGIFRRAFVRAYAQAIGLDADAVVREFLDLYPDPGDDVTAALATAVPTQKPEGAVRRLRAAIGWTVRSLAGSATANDWSAAPMEPAPPRDPAAPPPPAPVPVPTEDELHLVRAVPAGVSPAAAPVPPVHAEALAPARVDAVADETPGARAARAAEPDLQAVAHLCTALGRASDVSALVDSLGRAAAILDAAGIILWAWDPNCDGLRATLAHGYSDRVLAHLPAIAPDDDNVTAAAFRHAETRVMPGRVDTTGALAVPLLPPGGCAGVLALELRHGGERSPTVRALAAILAAQFATMVHVPEPAADCRLA